MEGVLQHGEGSEDLQNTSSLWVFFLMLQQVDSLWKSEVLSLCCHCSVMIIIGFTLFSKWV
jgi:hypothetical protein